jgi:hypothetical protein
MTPQERNQLIDEVIEGLIDRRELGQRLSICVRIGSSISGAKFRAVNKGCQFFFYVYTGFGWYKYTLVAF